MFFTEVVKVEYSLSSLATFNPAMWPSRTGETLGLVWPGICYLLHLSPACQGEQQLDFQRNSS